MELALNRVRKMLCQQTEMSNDPLWHQDNFSDADEPSTVLAARLLDALAVFAMTFRVGWVLLFRSS